MLKNYFIYYVQFALSVLLSVLITLLSLYTFKGIDYGTSVLFFTTLTYFTITTFGIHDSLKIKYREMENKDICYYEYRKMTVCIYILQVIVVLGFIIFSIATHRLFLFIVSLAILPNNMLVIYKELFLSVNRLLIINIVDIGLKLFQIIGILLVLIYDLNVWNYLFYNVVAMILILILIELYNRYNIKKTMSVEKKSDKVIFHIKKGIIYISGFWLMSTAFNIDFLFANTDPFTLKNYSILKSIVISFMLVVSPFKNFIFLSIEKDSVQESIFKYAFNLILSSYMIMNFGSIAIVIMIEIFKIPVSYYYLIGLLTMPLFVVYNIYIMNDLLVRGPKVILKFGIVTMGIFLSIFLIATSLFGVSPKIIFLCQFSSLLTVTTIYYLVYTNIKYTFLILLLVVIGSVLSMLNILVFKSLILYGLIGVLILLIFIYKYFKFTKNR